MQRFDESRREKNRQADNSENRENRAAPGGVVFENRDAGNRRSRKYKCAMDPLNLGNNAGEGQDGGQDRQSETMDKAQP